MTCPVAEPFDAFPCRMFRAQHMGRHRQAHKLMPPAQFPNQLDVSAARQTAVVQVKSEFIRLQVFADQIVGLPTWRVIDFYFEVAKSPPSSAQNISNVPLQRLA